MFSSSIQVIVLVFYRGKSHSLEPDNIAMIMIMIMMFMIMIMLMIMFMIMLMIMFIIMIAIIMIMLMIMLINGLHFRVSLRPQYLPCKGS